MTFAQYWTMLVKPINMATDWLNIEVFGVPLRNTLIVMFIASTLIMFVVNYRAPGGLAITSTAVKAKDAQNRRNSAKKGK